MTGKVKFYKSRDLIGPRAIQLAHDILFLNGLDFQSKGGRTKAANNATKLQERNEAIRADWHAMNAAGQKRHGAAKKLANKYGLKPYTVNKILRST